MMRHEFQRQRLGRRPGQGGSGRRQHPGLEIGEIGGEGPKTVLAHPFLGEMLEGRDILVGQNLGEAIAPVHRQDCRQGIEFQRPLRQRIAGEGRIGRVTHPARLSRCWTIGGFPVGRTPGNTNRGHRQTPPENGAQKTGVPPPMPGSGASASSPWPLCAPHAGMIRAPDWSGADELKGFRGPRESPSLPSLAAPGFVASACGPQAPKRSGFQRRPHLFLTNIWHSILPSAIPLPLL